MTERKRREMEKVWRDDREKEERDGESVAR